MLSSKFMNELQGGLAKVVSKITKKAIKLEKIEMGESVDTGKVGRNFDAIAAAFDEKEKKQ